MEDFLDDRWAPHYLDDYYCDAPIFDGDPQEYLTKIGAAVEQIRDAAEQLLRLALGRPVSVWSTHPGEYMEEGGFHAYLEWGDKFPRPDWVAPMLMSSIPKRRYDHHREPDRTDTPFPMPALQELFGRRPGSALHAVSHRVRLHRPD